MTDKLCIVMPAYNEEKNIENIVKDWHEIVRKVGSDSRLIIFNDGSTDQTYEKMLELMSVYSQFKAIDKINTGHGPTCMLAYHHAINEKADFIFQTDSDGQTVAEEFWQFWEKRNIYDFIIGYRDKRKDGISRKLVTKILKLTVWLVFGQFIKDCNTPFRLMKANKLKPIIKLIPNDFFLSNVIISLLVVKRKEKHLWLPITFNSRQGGVNSINIRKIVKIGVKAILDFHNLKQKISYVH